MADKSNGLYYMNARFYNPESGRFLSKDSYPGSAADPVTQNLYTYGNNNPTNMVDPTGHSAILMPLGRIIQYLWSAIVSAAVTIGTVDTAKKVISGGNVSNSSSKDNSKVVSQNSLKSKAMPQVQTKEKKKEDPLKPYDVGNYKELANKKKNGVASTEPLVIHHVPQVKWGNELINGGIKGVGQALYNYYNGPAIALPKSEHTYLVHNHNDSFESEDINITINDSIKKLRLLTNAPEYNLIKLDAIAKIYCNELRK